MGISSACSLASRIMSSPSPRISTNDCTNFDLFDFLSDEWLELALLSSLDDSFEWLPDEDDDDDDEELDSSSFSISVCIFFANTKAMYFRSIVIK